MIDAASMSVNRRRKNSLVGHGSPGSSYATPADAFGADGAAAVYRRQTLADCAIEGEVFDENMPGWGCDADLAWRARLLGWEARYEPAAVVHHIRTYSPTTRAHTSARDRRTQFRNRYLMIAKNDSLRDLLRDAGPLLLYELRGTGIRGAARTRAARRLRRGAAAAAGRAAPPAHDPGPSAGRAGAVRNGAPGERGRPLMPAPARPTYGARRRRTIAPWQSICSRAPRG